MGPSTVSGDDKKKISNWLETVDTDRESFNRCDINFRSKGGIIVGRWSKYEKEGRIFKINYKITKLFSYNWLKISKFSCLTAHIVKIIIYI